jgi:lipoprotein-anchoring transpeptidase ErfK/SrfK
MRRPRKTFLNCVVGGILNCVVGGILAGVAPLAAAAPARAELVIHIDKAAQRLTVERDGARGPVFVISTGRRGFGTPNGTYRPQRLERKWFSRRYYNSPMPYSIFFHGGYAIHGTNYLRQLGGPASHGCVRLHPANAATLYGLVKQEGLGRTRIVIEN